ncbi:MAG: BamA/TamA family outer membrane protein [Gemmatimonadetes bacterium]|jgi:outer membrane protein assembly factor BamA|nr:BamA/TamA family outer membrane protein [Gemmatimonadota bacterium]MBT7860165.1 BamA/TamA family outer membrane protein [Gemmatimonadota bacterium]
MTIIRLHRHVAYLRALVVGLSLLGIIAASSITANAQASNVQAIAADAPVGQVISSIEIVGARVTRDFVIRRELATRIGQAFDPQKLAADLQRLDNLDIFSSVQVDRQPQPDGTLHLVLRVRELPPVVPYITYDINDQNGWSFGPAIKSVNFLGRDVFVAGFALFGGRDSFLIDLNQPWWRGNHVSLGLIASRDVRDNDLDGFMETASEFTPRLGTWIGAHGRAAVMVSYMRFQADRQQVLLSSRGDDELLRLGGSIGYDSRDAWGNPHHGWLNELELWKTGGPLPGDGDFWTLHADMRRFQPVGDHTLVLAALTSLQSGDVGDEIPVYMDYHLGGANSLRGYMVDELGPELFGTHQLLSTIEYRLPLVRPREITLFGLAADIGLGGTLFADGGLAWTQRSQLDLDRARFGVGAGLRILVPAVDMTRIEVGFGEDGWRFYVASYSKMRAQRLRLR